MSVFYSGRIAGRIGPTGVPIIAVRMAAVGAFSELLGRPGGIPLTALVDTGCNTCVQIRQRHIEMLGLSQVGTMHTENIGFSGEVPRYEVDIAFDMASFGGQLFNFLMRSNPAMVPPSFADCYDIILPMSALQPFEMRFLPTGDFELLIR